MDGKSKKFDEPENIAEFHLTDPAQVILKTVEAALNNGIKVFVIDYPNYDYLASPNYQLCFKAFFERKGCRYLDYLADVNFRDKTLFFDEGHLNKKGATFFTKQLAKDLSEPLSNP